MVSILEIISLLSLLFWNENFILYIKHISFVAKKLGWRTRQINSIIIKKHVIAIWDNKTVARLDNFFTANLD